ncbi:MAG: hypothetical protein Q9227_008001 [Pyrenula ochraceoflavens]
MSIPVKAAKLLSQYSFQLPETKGRLLVTEYQFNVPLDYTAPTDKQLRLFARGVDRTEIPLVPDDRPRPSKPWLTYLTGGPGFGCDLPENLPWTNWMLCLDQRGFGLSNTLTTQTIQSVSTDPKVQAEYLSKFRADNSVRDCEAIRQCLMEGLPEERRKWTIMGQSYGGFMATTYLSFYPEGLREAFILGGLPPLRDGPEDTYRRLYARLRTANATYHTLHPHDASHLHQILTYLLSHPIPTLPPTRFLSLGLLLGFHGGPSRLHSLLTRFTLDLTTFGHPTSRTVDEILESALGIESGVAYALLHEPLYCALGHGTPSSWTADRLRHSSSPSDEFHDFQPPTSLSDLSTRQSRGKLPALFTAEQIFPLHLSSSPALAPLLPAAEILASKTDWPALYNLDQLGKNEVPVYAAVYLDDLYVDCGLSLETARGIKGCRVAMGNGLLHNAVRARVEECLGWVWRLREEEGGVVQ